MLPPTPSQSHFPGTEQGLSRFLLVSGFLEDWENSLGKRLIDNLRSHTILSWNYWRSSNTWQKEKKKILEIPGPELPGNSSLGINLCTSPCLVRLTHGLPNSMNQNQAKHCPSPYQDIFEKEIRLLTVRKPKAPCGKSLWKDKEALGSSLWWLLQIHIICSWIFCTLLLCSNIAFFVKINLWRKCKWNIT